MFSYLKTKERRIRGDLIQMFKIVNGHEKINLVNGVNFAKSLKMNLRREHNIKWNDLPQNVVIAEKVSSFKSGIDKEVFSLVHRKQTKTATAQLELNAVW
ncbi:hypothetical protein BpHYR1_014297, partial [Brachionus plicatilis]